MIDHLRALAVFAKVAEAGSFRAAAKNLGISASVVSHHVTSLERHLDTPLIYRTTRRLSLTSAGKQLAGSASKMLSAAEDGFAHIGHASSNPTGSLNISAPAIFQYARFLARVSTFAKRNPRVEITVSFSDRRHNIVEEGFDLAFRIGTLRDSSLIARKLTDGTHLICASPGYLQDQPKIRHPSDLTGLQQIQVAGVSPPMQLTSTGRKPVKQTIRIPSRITVDSGFAAMRMAKLGCGIAVLPDFLVREAITAGELVDALPRWSPPPFGIFAVWPNNPGTNALRTSFVDFIGGIADPDSEIYD